MPETGGNAHKRKLGRRTEWSRLPCTPLLARLEDARSLRDDADGERRQIDAGPQRHADHALRRHRLAADDAPGLNVPTLPMLAACRPTNLTIEAGGVGRPEQRRAG